MSRRADRKRVVILAVDVELVLDGLPERPGAEAARARMLVRRMLAGLRGSVRHPELRIDPLCSPSVASTSPCSGTPG